MRRLLLLVFLLLGGETYTQAQYAALQSSTLSGIGSQTYVRLIGSGVTQNKLTWTITGGTLAACTIKMEQSVDAVTPADLGSSASCASAGTIAPVVGTINYVRVTLVAPFTVATGTPVINFVYTGYRNGVNVDSGVVAFKTQNSVRYCDQFLGATAGAKIAACIADLPSTGGTADARGFEGAQTIDGFTITKPNVIILFSPSAAWTITNTIIIRAQGVWLRFGSNPVASTVNGDVIWIDGSTATGSATLMNTPYLNGGITGLHLTANSGANAVGIHLVDALGFVYDDVAMEDFTGVNAAGIWVDNQAGPSGGFSERTSFRKLSLQRNTKGLRFSKSGGNASTLYTVISETHLEVGAGQIGLSLEGGVSLFNSQIHITANMNDVASPGTVLQVSGGAGIQSGVLDVIAEQTTGTGGIGLKVADLTSFIQAASGVVTLNGGLVNSVPKTTTGQYNLGTIRIADIPSTIRDNTVLNVPQRTTNLQLGVGGAAFALPSYGGVENNGKFQVYARNTGDLRRLVERTVYDPTFTGSGLNDMNSGGEHTASTDNTYTVIIDGTGSPNTFKWQKDAGAFTTLVAITGAAQTLSTGVTITFTATAGHTLTDQWAFNVGSAKVPIIYADGLNKRMGLGTTVPTALLGLDGSISFEVAISNVTKGLFWNAGGDTSLGAIYRNAGNGNIEIVPQTNLLVTQGTLISPLYATSTNCAVNSVSPGACGSAAAGSFVIPTTTTTYTVNTTAITANSRIFLFPHTDTRDLPGAPTCVVPTITAQPVVSSIAAGTSFTMTITSTAGQTCWDYWKVN